MRKNYLIAFPIFLLVLLFAIICYSQVHGRIISKTEADEQFDSVLISVTMSVESLQELISGTRDNIMFKIDNDSVIVLDNNRNVLFPEGKVISSEDIFTLYSVSVLNNLFLQGNAATVYIEQRTNVLTITNGNYTMEFGTLCPPYCF